MIKKLLIVEDEKNISFIISENAKIEGYECDVSYDGEDGLKKALTNEYDLIVLDEINNVFVTKDFEWQRAMPFDEVLCLLRNHDKSRHVILTGRNAPDELIAVADLVTEMRCVKHYYDEGTAAAKGLEF